MTIDNKREQIQMNAVNALLLNKDADGKVRGTVEVITGLGKTFIALHMIKILQPKTVMFLAETTVMFYKIKLHGVTRSKNGKGNKLRTNQNETFWVESDLDLESFRNYLKDYYRNFHVKILKWRL